MAEAYVAIGVLGSMFIAFVVLCLVAVIEFGPSCEQWGERGDS